jgi:PucR C-terminal helix-turn-helix domain/GGDEF-like domain
MSHTANGRVASLVEVRAVLVERLRSRRSEIHEVISAHVRDVVVFGPAGERDAEYVAGLQATVTAVLDYVLVGIERGEEWSGPIPSVAVAQAHRAARNGVGLDTVLRRYAAGNRLLVGFVMAEADDLPNEALRQVLEMGASLVERLMAGVSIEYNCEIERAGRSLEQRRAELVRRLLAGELVDTAELGYEFDAWHLGVIATGDGAREALRALAGGSDRQLLPVSRGEETVWGWLGGKRRLAVADIERLLQAGEDVVLAVGEPRKGVDGWRLTHRQAQAALLVALRSRERLTRYADVALLAAALRDDVLARWLVETFLSPLDSQRDRGAALRETLRCYIAAGRNVSKVAVELGVKRQTVEHRRQTVEQVLGRELPTCLAELEVALRLEELGPARN